MADMIQFFTVVILVQLFFAIGITIVVYTLPVDTQEQVSGYSDMAGSIDIPTVANRFESSVNRITNTPIVDIGILVFYSGNVILDLLINFAFATPQMISLVFNGLSSLWGFDGAMMNYVQIFMSVAMMVVYFIGLLTLVTNIRAGRVA